MRRFSRSRTYANIKAINSAVFIALGIFIIIQIFRLGFHIELLTGTILALAFVGLGATRLRAHFKEKKP